MGSFIKGAAIVIFVAIVMTLSAVWTGLDKAAQDCKASSATYAAAPPGVFQSNYDFPGGNDKEKNGTASELVRAAIGRNAPRSDQALLLMVGLHESEMTRKPTPYGGAYGVLQMTPSIGGANPYWGTVAQVEDPKYAANRWLDELAKKVPNRNSMSSLEVILEVQNPNRAKYRARWAQHDWEKQAADILQSGYDAAKNGAALGDNSQEVETYQSWPARVDASSDTYVDPCVKRQPLDVAAAGTLGSPNTLGTRCAVGIDAGLHMTALGNTIRTCNVRGTIVNASKAADWNALLQASDAAGLQLSGSGFRTLDSQIRLRTQNCGGASHYAVYEKPSNQCSPPTATPGNSQHEQALAIDVQDNGMSISSHFSRAWVWLKGNAHRWGFFNLPSEPWHWSTTGK